MTFQSSLGENVWSGSRIDALVCPRRFYYSYERDLELVEDAPRLHAGTVIHAALDAWYNTDYTAAAARDIDAISVAKQTWGGYQPPIASDLSYLTWGHIENVLRAYFDHWRTRETFTPLDVRLPDGQRVGSETPVVHDFGSFLYGGRLDLPVEDQSGNVYVMDHKSTTGNMGDYYFAQFCVSDKNRGYVALLESLLDRPVAGVVINGIYMGKSPRKPDSAFQRKVYHFSAGHIDEWKNNVSDKIYEAMLRQDIDLWPQTTANRICSGCAFRKVCETSPRVRESILKRDYRERNLEVTVG
jgi:hypothetical protein